MIHSTCTEHGPPSGQKGTIRRSHCTNNFPKFDTKFIFYDQDQERGNLFRNHIRFAIKSASHQYVSKSNTFPNQSLPPPTVPLQHIEPLTLRLAPAALVESP